MLPFVPHWKVPRFIRACTAVCFLERDFPIAIHGPVIPREVLAYGTCLVLSREIYDKQVYRDRLEDGRDVVIVEDPKDHASLATALRSVVERPERAAEIGAAGHRVSAALEDYGRTVDAWESLVQDVRPASGEPAPVDVLPWLHAVLGERVEPATTCSSTGSAS
ncbi:glycosyltransferase [Actinomadura sp. DC4]|uniref:glycosyltransferase n=1 Tax=Actinomadura sp. DC4 TaxID=3055069 RepID=UPI0025B00171|nr:glycosyltransferase [Actinomadura sp. DC4]MDN3358547.1 glycosyltransferase [Actinomadura sp. DC4]